VDRRRFLATFVAAGVTVPFVAEAQPPGRVARIGFLSSASFDSALPIHEALRQGLRKSGWVEKQNIVIEYRFADGHERLHALAAELVGFKVDVIVALATPAIAAAKKVTQTIPIVMIGSGDPVGSGFVASLSRPGGNVTGLAFSSAGMGILAKQLELLMEAVPKISRVAILSNPTNPNHPRWTKELTDAGRSLRVELQVLEVRNPGEFDGAFAAMAKEHAGAVLVVADSIFIRHRTRLVALAAKTRLPSFAQYREIVEAGALMSYAPSLSDLGRGAAAYVDKILRGAAPADLPVEQPAKLDLTINLKTAKVLALTIPPSLLLRADQVIDP
jgi:putative tryptophan/tyrosine transport system substrate-binding protein